MRRVAFSLWAIAVVALLAGASFAAAQEHSEKPVAKPLAPVNPGPQAVKSVSAPSKVAPQTAVVAPPKPHVVTKSPSSVSVTPQSAAKVAEAIAAALKAAPKSGPPGAASARPAPTRALSGAGPALRPSASQRPYVVRWPSDRLVVRWPSASVRVELTWP